MSKTGVKVITAIIAAGCAMVSSAATEHGDRDYAKVTRDKLGDRLALFCDKLSEYHGKHKETVTWICSVQHKILKDVAKAYNSAAIGNDRSDYAKAAMADFWLPDAFNKVSETPEFDEFSQWHVQNVAAEEQVIHKKMAELLMSTVLDPLIHCATKSLDSLVRYCSETDNGKLIEESFRGREEEPVPSVQQEKTAELCSMRDEFPAIAQAHARVCFAYFSSGEYQVAVKGDISFKTDHCKWFRESSHRRDDRTRRTNEKGQMMRASSTFTGYFNKAQREYPDDPILKWASLIQNEFKVVYPK